MPYNSRSAVRLSVGVWVLMSGVLIAVFTTLLTSYLTVPKLKPIVNSFRELGASNHYKLVEPLDTDVAELFLVCILKSIIIIITHICSTHLIRMLKSSLTNHWVKH